MIETLERHHYKKFIIGAALKDFAAIENYAYYFTIAGASAIDISAFPLSVISARRGIERALEKYPDLLRPEIMVSINVSEDAHFRRVVVDWNNCTQCNACVPACPSQAFYLDDGFKYNEDLCFGCDNCLSYCHYDALEMRSWTAFEAGSFEELKALGATAFEIHLNNDLEALRDLYDSLPVAGIYHSFSIGSEQMSADDLCLAVDVIVDMVRARFPEELIIIQCDGKPMSGAKDSKDDQIAIDNARVVIDHFSNDGAFRIDPKIFIQISGGINEKSLAKAHAQGLAIHGVAIGSYARLKILEYQNSNLDPEEYLPKLFDNHSINSGIPISQ